jgi:hypothetical protein
MSLLPASASETHFGYSEARIRRRGTGNPPGWTRLCNRKMCSNVASSNGTRSIAGKRFDDAIGTPALCLRLTPHVQREQASKAAAEEDARIAAEQAARQQRLSALRTYAGLGCILTPTCTSAPGRDTRTASRPRDPPRRDRGAVGTAIGIYNSRQGLCVLQARSSWHHPVSSP